MSFDTAKGTRGARQPSGPSFRWVNTRAARRLPRKGGKTMGFNALALTTVGRKGGLERSNPVGWFPGPDGSWLIVASEAGAADNPAWYYNLAANPNKVYIELEGRKIAVTPEQLHRKRTGRSVAADHFCSTALRQVRAEDRPGTADRPAGRPVPVDS
jgi:deazaflavin-dependent oxidoreductase (nitroreductase family)